MKFGDYIIGYNWIQNCLLLLDLLLLLFQLIEAKKFNHFQFLSQIVKRLDHNQMCIKIDLII